MRLVKYIIEYNEKVTINNEYTVNVEKNRPLLLEWFADNEIIVHPAGQTIKIDESTFIVRSRAENKENKTETKINKDEKVTIQKLNTVLGHVKITKYKKDVVTESYIAIQNQSNNNFQLSTFNFQLSDIELPIAFLQCVQYGDFENARAMLSFDISDTHLRDYFGDFEVLINNYLDQPELVSILPAGSDTARTFRFQIQKGKISNINDKL